MGSRSGRADSAAGIDGYSAAAATRRPSLRPTVHRPDFSPLPSHTLQNWDRSQGCCYNWKRCFVSDLQSRFGRQAVGIGDNNYVCQVYFQKWVLDCLAGEKSLRSLKSMLSEYRTWSSGGMSTDQVLPKNSYFKGPDEKAGNSVLGRLYSA